MGKRTAAILAAIMTTVGIAGALDSGAAGTGEEELAGTAPYRRLFLDAMVVEESAGLTREFHAAEKYEGNPVLEKAHAWEGWGPYVYGTVLKQGGKLRMWYQCIGGESADVMMAESEDGIAWTRPELGFVQSGGETNINIVGPRESCHIPSVIKVPEPASPERQWAMYGYAGKAGAAVAFSPDGLRWNWERGPEQTNLFSTSDVTNFFFDPYKSRYVATYKTSNRRHRAAGVAVSRDGLTWTKPVEGAVFGADDLDPDATQIYGMPVFPYQGMYIGLPWIYHARWIKYGKYTKPEVMYEAQEGSPRTVDVQMAWSWDLINWTRPPAREPFIGLGEAGAFDDAGVYTARAPVMMGDKLYFYYGGFDTLHDGEGADTHGAIGLATLRLDGFCSMRAGDEEGWLISRRELFNTPRVRINAKCGEGGYVAAEIVDRENRVVPGFSREECAPFGGDSVEHVLTWKTEAFPEGMVDKDRKIRFFVRNAELYSYLPEGINTAIDDSRPD